MNLAEFIAMHEPALEANEVRHNLMLGLLDSARRGRFPDLRTWSLGSPGACAIQTSADRGILLGELDRPPSRALAEDLQHVNYPGVAGTDRAPGWFVERAIELGARFEEPLAQRVHAIGDPPIYPACPGEARPVMESDIDLLAAWMEEFRQEAVPHDPPYARSHIQTAMDRYLFWVVAGEPVAMAGIARRTRSTAAIAPVYTPPQHRNRGYAGAATAAVVDRVYAEGRRAACLYTSLDNPASNRCYAKIGFRPVCDAWVYRRTVDAR
jgi:RimJ/RimL family protein N-acetyltransferase